MAFSEKVLRFTFSGAQSGSFTAAGLRSAVNIQAYPGRSGTTAQVKIWGLSLAQMNAYSSKISSAPSISDGVVASQFNLIIEAGDQGGMSTALNGAILRSFIDFSGAPDSCFDVTAIDTYGASIPIAPQSVPGGGPQNAADLIANVCAASLLTLDNSAGASAILRNQSTYGSGIDQIACIANAAKFSWKKTGDKVFIWPQDGTVDDVVIDVGPGTDPKMVGYPNFWEAGIIVTSLYNSQVQIGRKMNVVNSIIKNANGLWKIQLVGHSLTTMLAKGPWFTTAVLSPIGT
jgi:hypothetical protein